MDDLDQLIEDAEVLRGQPGWSEEDEAYYQDLIRIRDGQNSETEGSDELPSDSTEEDREDAKERVKDYFIEEVAPIISSIVESAQAIWAYYEEHKEQLQEVSGLESETELLSWYVTQVVEGVSIPGLPDLPNIEVPLDASIAETVAIIILHIPFINRIVPTRFRLPLLVLTYINWFGKGAAYALFDLGPEDQGSLEKWAVDWLFITAKQLNPINLLGHLIDQAVQDIDKEERLAQLKVGQILKDKYGNRYEVIEGNRVRLLNDTPFSSAGTEYELDVDEGDGRIFLRSWYGGYDLVEASNVGSNGLLSLDNVSQGDERLELFQEDDNFVPQRQRGFNGGGLLTRNLNKGGALRRTSNKGLLSQKIGLLHDEGYTAPGQAYAIAKSMGYNQGYEVLNPFIPHRNGEVANIDIESPPIKREGLGGAAWDVVSDFVPVLGDIKGAIELYEALQEDPIDEILVGALVASLVIGLAPGVGDAITAPIKALARAGRLLPADVVGVLRAAKDGDIEFLRGWGKSAEAESLSAAARGAPKKVRRIAFIDEAGEVVGLEGDNAVEFLIEQTGKPEKTIRNNLSAGRKMIGKDGTIFVPVKEGEFPEDALSRGLSDARIKIKQFVGPNGESFEGTVDDLIDEIGNVDEVGEYEVSSDAVRKRLNRGNSFNGWRLKDAPPKPDKSNIKDKTWFARRGRLEEYYDQPGITEPKPEQYRRGYNRNSGGMIRRRFGRGLLG